MAFKLFIDGGLERGRPTPLKLFFTKCYNYIAFLFLTIGTDFNFFFFLVDKKREYYIIIYKRVYTAKGSLSLKGHGLLVSRFSISYTKGTNTKVGQIS